MLDLKIDLKIDLELEQIWAEYYTDCKDPISPLYQRELRPNNITFLSLNPSLRPEAIKTAKKGYYPDFPYPLIDCENPKAEYAFFQKFYDIGLDFRPWTVLDLLYERESTQKELEIRYNKKNINSKDKVFLQSQIKLTFKILEILRPRLVVVTNGGTDRLIHANLNDLDLIQELPHESNGYVYRINGIPFITNESRFLGSRYIEHNTERRLRLKKEMERVINIT